MNKLASISKKAELSGKIVKLMYPEATDEEVVQRSRQCMKKSLLDLQMWYSALTKDKK